jgi:Fur family peroxide stress response transcriptional regulator
MADPDLRLEQLILKLEEQSLRLTPQRMAVLKILSVSEGHPSVQQIYEQVRADFPMTSLGTIYKTVTLLKDMGEVLELSFSEDGCRYDGNKPFPHPHLVCVKCRRIMDPELSILGVIPQELGETTGYQIVGHRLDFYGICPQCREQG